MACTRRVPDPPPGSNFSKTGIEPRQLRLDDFSSRGRRRYDLDNDHEPIRRRFVSY